MPSLWGFLTVLILSLLLRSVFLLRIQNNIVRYDFLDNTVMIFSSISYSCMGLLFLRGQFLPKYSIFRSQIYLQIFRSPWKLTYGFTNVSPLLPGSSLCINTTVSALQERNYNIAIYPKNTQQIMNGNAVTI